MITVEEAKNSILNNVFAITETIQIETNGALGYTLAEDIYTPLDLPPFNQSNVDGYAVSDIESKSWNVISEIKSGDNSNIKLNKGEAVRIFTGAMVPENAACVIMQEKITRIDHKIYVDDSVLVNGEHIRRKGMQIQKGELAIKKDTVVTPSIMVFVASLGLKIIKVYRQPVIKLIITGNELQSVGTKLESGKVYDSNSISLSAALVTMGLRLKDIVFVKDEKDLLAVAVNNALKNTDVLLISGGISVGDYDFVNEVLKENKTTTLFYKIAQKPGKPLYFGKNNNTFVFGLPGNPASALTCFYEYVFPCLRKLQQRNDVFLRTLNLPIEQIIYKKKGLANFLKAQASATSVLSLDGQESFKMRSFTDANAFIYLPSEKETINAGELVEVHLLSTL